MRFFIFLGSFVLLARLAQAQPASINEAKVSDSLFWEAYNHCDVAKMKSYFSDDVEFYHDKGGITLGADALANSFLKGPCRNSDSFSLRRAEVPNTVKLYPLQKNGILYGVIVTGEHLFYINEKNKKEYADGHAQFSNLWLIENSSWKMKRVFSYDHQPVSQNKEKAMVTVSAAILKEYVGKYQGRKNGTMTVQSAKGYLVITSGGARFDAYPSSSTVFFSKEKNLTFQFAKKGAGIMDVTVRENDEIVETFPMARR